MVVNLFLIFKGDVPEQATARGEGHDVALGLDIGVANLPIAALEVIDRAVICVGGCVWRRDKIYIDNMFII